MPTDRVSQFGLEAMGAVEVPTRVSQFGLEIGINEPALMRVSQFGWEILRSADAPPPPPVPPVLVPEARYIRRMRTAPHLSDEQVRNIHKWFQLDVQAGVGDGDPDSQGVNPKVCLRWSDDGGHTWSSEYWRDAGQRGRYNQRLIWNRLGQSSDRIYEISMSDPVQWVILQALLNVTRGTS
jgi:hypothetical protein